MRKTKLILSLLLTTSMVIGLTACAGKSTSESTSSEASNSKKVYHIGICQLVEHEALDAATEGFKEELTQKLGKDHVVFDLQNAQGEQTNCATITNGFVSNNVDLIMANATASLQAAASATNKIPIVATSITDYKTALNMKDWSGTTKTNITGTSDLAPIDQQEAMIKELIPTVKKVGIIYCSAEPNSIYQAHQMESYLKKDNIDFKEYTAADSNEIQSVTTKAVSECDVLYVPTDNVMAANIDIVKNISVPAKVPMIAGEEGICQGGLATLSISYKDIGKKTADMAYDILVNKKDPGTMPIAFASKTTKEYNEAIAKELGITIPSDYVKLKTK